MASWSVFVAESTYRVHSGQECLQQEALEGPSHMDLYGDTAASQQLSAHRHMIGVHIVYVVLPMTSYYDNCGEARSTK